MTPSQRTILLATHWLVADKRGLVRGCDRSSAWQWHALPPSTWYSHKCSHKPTTSTTTAWYHLHHCHNYHHTPMGVLLDPCVHRARTVLTFGYRLLPRSRTPGFFHEIGFFMVVVDARQLFSCCLTIGCPVFENFLLRVPRARCDFSPVGIEWRYHGMLPQGGHRGLSITFWCPIVVFAWDLACWGPRLGSRAPCRFKTLGFASFAFNRTDGNEC